MKKLLPILIPLLFLGCASTFRVAYLSNNLPGTIDHYNLQRSTDLATWTTFTNYPGVVGTVTNTVSTLGAGDWWLRITAVSTNSVESDPSNVIRVSVPSAPLLFRIIIEQ